MSRHAIGVSARTLGGITPGDALQLAAEAGLDHIGVALEPPYLAPGVARALRRAQAATGVRVLDTEPVRLTEAPDFDAIERLLDLSAELGARHVLVVGHDADLHRVAAHFARLCRAAAERRLQAALEFMPFRGVATLGQALAVVAAAADDAGRLVVDNQHLARAGGEPADLSAVPSGLLANAQLCDIVLDDRAMTPEALMDEALHARLLPGDGTLPCREFLARLEPGVPISLELLGGRTRARYGSDLEFLRALKQRTQSLLAPA